MFDFFPLGVDFVSTNQLLQLYEEQRWTVSEVKTHLVCKWCECRAGFPIDRHQLKSSATKGENSQVLKRKFTDLTFGCCGNDPSLLLVAGRFNVHQKWTATQELLICATVANHSFIHKCITKSLSGVFVTPCCVLESHPPLRVSHMGSYLGSCIICWHQGLSVCACVNKCVCRFICM